MAGAPVSSGQIYKKFSGLLDKLKTQAKAAADAVSGNTAREWQLPPELTTKLTNISGMVTPFQRDDMNSGFDKLVNNGESPGTVGDVIGVKTQIDYTAAMERAFRARHATPIRCLVHAAARRAGHGDAQGIFGDAAGVLKFSADAIQAGRGGQG